MKRVGFRTIAASGAGVAILAGCVSLHQDDEHVLIRDPSLGAYREPAETVTPAEMQWEYAAMSLNAYMKVEDIAAAPNKVFEPALQDVRRNDRTQFDAACAKDNKAALMPLPGWSKWKDFPSQSLRERMLKQGMYFEVFERSTAPRVIAIVFEGTTPGSRDDLPSNLHWFRRFFPGEDQYTLAAKHVTKDFVDYLKARNGQYHYSSERGRLQSQNGETIKLVATGHSLGGGLAQHFAYNFLQEERQPAGPRIEEVYAFNPSPVTGWFSSPEPARSYNAKGLQIHRVWERGEVLGFLRYVTSRLAMSAENPAIWEYRYNFDNKPYIIRNHSMQNLACGLSRAAKPWQRTS